MPKAAPPCSNRHPVRTAAEEAVVAAADMAATLDAPGVAAMVKAVVAVAVAVDRAGVANETWKEHHENQLRSCA